jgi:hypothetical protein
MAEVVHPEGALEAIHGAEHTVRTPGIAVGRDSLRAYVKREEGGREVRRETREQHDTPQLFPPCGGGGG